MGLYGDEKDYEELVKENIAKAKILATIPEQNRELALKLLKEKELVMKKNDLFANIKLKKINKKLNKLKQH